MFYESPRFPEHISFGMTGGPTFKTDVVVTDGGDEQRNVAWTQARHTYEAAHAARLPAQYGALRAFFQTMNGRAHGFRFKDWSDYKHNDNGGSGVFVAIDATHFQITKRYTSGSQTQDRAITKPISPITVTGGSGVSINYTTGIVTVSSGTPTSWTGEFDVPCRFDTDEMRGEIINKSGDKGFIMGWNSIPIIEIRV